MAWSTIENHQQIWIFTERKLDEFRLEEQVITLITHPTFHKDTMHFLRIKDHHGSGIHVIVLVIDVNIGIVMQTKIYLAAIMIMWPPLVVRRGDFMFHFKTIGN